MRQLIRQYQQNEHHSISSEEHMDLSEPEQNDRDEVLGDADPQNSESEKTQK